MRFAEIAAARHKGVSLVEGSAEFGLNNAAMWGCCLEGRPVQRQPTTLWAVERTCGTAARRAQLDHLQVHRDGVFSGPTK